jgi:transcriptional regulator GlxA family with amidase domain
VREALVPQTEPVLRISLVAVPEASPGTLAGLHEVFCEFAPLSRVDPAVAGEQPFALDIVTPRPGPMRLGMGLALTESRSVDDVVSTDIVIVPPVMAPADADWQTGRYPEVLAWMHRMHDAGAQICSACSGALLLAETGLLDGRTATTHWALAGTFQRLFPAVSLALDKTLIIEGERRQFMLSGAASAWQDLALCLIAQHLGTAVAQAVARFHALNAHLDGMAPYAVFVPRLDHGDAAVTRAQRWIAENLACRSPVESMSARADMAARNFKRHFTRATGYTPIHYVQALRIEEAKRLLERTTESVGEIAWRVGYDEPAFFRRLFKRLVGLTPNEHRRRFNMSRFAKV